MQDADRSSAVLRPLPPAPQRARRRPFPRRAAMGVLGAIVFPVTIFLLVVGFPRARIVPTPEELSAFHHDLLAGRSTVINVPSLETASDALSTGWPAFPRIRDFALQKDATLPVAMPTLHGRKVSCILLPTDAGPVTLAIARASEIQLPSDAPAITRDGVQFHVFSAAEGVSAIVTGHNNRWICLIGAMPSDRLIAFESRLRF